MKKIFQFRRSASFANSLNDSIRVLENKSNALPIKTEYQKKEIDFFSDSRLNRIMASHIVKGLLGLLLVMSSFVLFTSSAWAIFDPGAEKVLWATQMLQIEKAEGVFQNISDLQIIQAEKQSMNEIYYKLNLNSKVYVFEVVGAEDICGSFLSQSKEGPINTFGEYSLHFQLLDNQTRFCKDKKDYMWELTLIARSENNKVVGTLIVKANPTPIFSIQSNQPAVSTY